MQVIRETDRHLDVQHHCFTPPEDLRFRGSWGWGARNTVMLKEFQNFQP